TFAGALLDPTDELVDVAVGPLKIIVGQVGPSLLHLALEFVPPSLKVLHVDGHLDFLPLVRASGRPPARSGPRQPAFATDAPTRLHSFIWLRDTASPNHPPKIEWSGSSCDERARLALNGRPN